MEEKKRKRRSGQPSTYGRWRGFLHTVRKTLRLVIRGYFSHDVGRNGAALAYYLLFALFPMLLFISNLLGLLRLDVAAVTDALAQFLPEDVVTLVEGYLRHVAQNSSPALFSFALVFTVYFPMRAANGLMRAVRRAYHLSRPARPFRYTVRQLLYTLVLLLAVALSLLFSTAGEWVMTKLLALFPAVEQLPVTEALLAVWYILRFVLLAVVMYAALATLYAISQDSRQPLRAMLPGTLGALIAWMAVSVGFSFYVEHFASYSVVYGTLGAVIALLIWLYLTAVILILGAELNAALQTVHAQEEARRCLPPDEQRL